VFGEEQKTAVIVLLSLIFIMVSNGVVFHVNDVYILSIVSEICRVY